MIEKRDQIHATSFCKILKAENWWCHDVTNILKTNPGSVITWGPIPRTLQFLQKWFFRKWPKKRLQWLSLSLGPLPALLPSSRYKMLHNFHTYLLNSVNPVISCLLELTGISDLTVLKNWFIISVHPLHPQSVTCPNTYKHIECAQSHRTQVQTLVLHPSFQILPIWILQNLSRKCFSVPSLHVYLHCECLRQDDSPGLFTSLL